MTAIQQSDATPPNINRKKPHAMAAAKKFVKKEYCNDACCKWINSDLASSIVSSLFDILRERLFVKAIFSKSVVHELILYLFDRLMKK